VTFGRQGHPNYAPAHGPGGKNRLAPAAPGGYPCAIGPAEGPRTGTNGTDLTAAAPSPAASPAESLDDEALVAHILATGDTELFGIIYDRYANKVYRKCLSVIKESNTAQDLVHDILVKVFVSLPTFKGQSKLGSWIYAITYNR
jgi:hypothetical protein